MFYFDSATRTIEAKRDRIFFVRLTVEEALFFFLFWSHDSYSFVSDWLALDSCRLNSFAERLFCTCQILSSCSSASTRIKSHRLCRTSWFFFESFSLQLELQHSFLMSWRATLILKQRGIVSIAACVGDMKARMALCCIASRKCRDNVYKRSITLSLPFSYCYLHMIENTSFPSCKQLCAWYCLRFAEFIE